MSTLYSYHTFMFPFRWKKPADLEKFGWKYQNFDPTRNVEAYNEFTYFHEFVQAAIFNTAQKPDDRRPSNYFEKKEFEKQPFKFKIRLKDYQNNRYEFRDFSLEIDGVTLRTFETGVAILSLNLKNLARHNFQDALLINDFGRRLYPQFLSAPQNGNYADETYNAFLPVEVSFATYETESFDVKDKITLPKLPSYITALIGCNEIKPLLDDRMFVLSHVMDSALSSYLKSRYQNSPLWYKYVYADSISLNCQNDEMLHKLIAQSTYDRWSGYGTLYGITRYSFVCLSDAGDFSKNVINQHIRHHYFQMMNLTLAVRASIIHFSHEVTRISALEEGDKSLLNEVTHFYKKYINFVNRLYFREISPQEQGIELYAKSLEIMQIEKNIKDLDEEIAELFNYADMMKQTSLNTNMAKLTEVGIPLMVAGLFAGIFGMNTIDFNQNALSPIWGLFSLGCILVLAFFSYVQYKKKDTL
ncbi:MAG: hypothetical protein AB7S65_11375 [Sulfuricurvum sp.]